MAAIHVPLIAVDALPEGRRLAMTQELWRRAEELFHAALERSPEDRQANYMRTFTRISGNPRLNSLQIKAAPCYLHDAVISFGDDEEQL